MTTDLIHLYEDILASQGIQFLLFSDTNLDMITNADYGFRGKIYENYNYQLFFHDILKNTGTSPLFFFRDDFQLNYCFFELPELIREEYHADYALIGPVIFKYITNSGLEQILHEHHFPVTLSKDFMEFFNRIPTLPSHDFWISLLMPLLKPLFGSSSDYHFTDISDSLNHNGFDNTLQLEPSSSEISFDAIADRYRAENQMLQAVADGNKDEAVKLYHKFRQFNLSDRTPDMLRNLKNWLIILNTNLRKTMETAQVHPYYIDKLSREFAIKIESTNSMVQLENLNVTMLRRYSMLAHNYSTKEYSPLIKKCIEQIRFFYQESISLETLSAKCAVTPSYLSVQFHKETGSTVTEYIHTVRLSHAILLLNSTQLSIQEIASQCGFPDPNYFTRTFKKHKGLTPNAYRKSIV